MRQNSGRVRWMSLAIAVLSLYALLTPLGAGPLETPGGYRVEFVWHQFRWLARPLNFEMLFLLGGGALLLTCVYHLSRVFRPGPAGPVLWPSVCLAACVVFRSWCIDLPLVSDYFPRFCLDGWRILAFTGGVSSLLGLVLQIAVVVTAWRSRLRVDSAG